MAYCANEIFNEALKSSQIVSIDPMELQRMFGRIVVKLQSLKEGITVLFRKWFELLLKSIWTTKALNSFHQFILADAISSLSFIFFPFWHCTQNLAQLMLKYFFSLLFTHDRSVLGASNCFVWRAVCNIKEETAPNLDAVSSGVYWCRFQQVIPKINLNCTYKSVPTTIVLYLL